MDNLVDQILALQLETATLKRTAGRMKKLEDRRLLEIQELKRLDRIAQQKYQALSQPAKKNWKDLFFDRQEERQRIADKLSQEYYAAALALKEAEQKIKLLEFEIGIIREKVAAIPEMEAKLQRLKREKENAAAIAIKRESDHDIVLKNRFRVASHQLIRSGQNIQLYLDAIENSLNQIETWQNWQHLQSEKEKIFRQEFDNIEKALQAQTSELSSFNNALQKLSGLDQFIDPGQLGDMEKITKDCNQLKTRIERFIKNTLENLSAKPDPGNELTKLKSRIVEIQSQIDQSVRLPE